MGTSKCGAVVVGVNGSPNSIVALHRATDTARRLGVDLDIVLVVAPQAGDSLVAAERGRLERLVRREFPGGVGVASRCQVERGDPAVVLLRASVGARLLVLGTREHSAAGGLFGSTTVSRCVDNARCAVEICVDQHASAASAGAIRASDQQGSASAVLRDGRQVKLRQLEASCCEGSR